MQWISDEGATISKLLKHGSLWVMQKLPPVGSPKRQVWEAEAEDGDTADKLIRRWAGTSLPRNGEARERRFVEMLNASGPSVLVLHNAHLLRGDRLAHMRLFSEGFAPVILVGDVLEIGSKIITQKNATGFMQRAIFCITPTRLFEEGP